jgi:hypothetical protein
MRGNRFSWEMDRVDISHHEDTAWAWRLFHGSAPGKE